MKLYEDTPYWPIVLTALHTGMRRSESLGLRWRDIDLDLGTVSVRQVMHRLGTGEFIFDRPKTAKSRRLIPLGATIILALKQHRIEEMAKAQLIGWSNSDESQVFTRLDGSSMLPDTLSHQFIKRARVAGFDRLTFHALRHTRATWMLQQDIHPKIVQERLGHASMSTTLDTYSHVVPGLQQAAAVQFDTLIQKASIKTEPVLAH